MIQYSVSEDGNVSNYYQSIEHVDSISFFGAVTIESITLPFQRLDMTEIILVFQSLVFRYALETNGKERYQ